MLKHYINNISSNDPVLDILQTDPNNLFKRPFAGHIILLFGELDEEVATWFSRAIISLDSLTGDDIACVIYAKKILVTIDNNPSFCPSFSFSGEDNAEGIIISHINKIQDFDALVKDGKSTWTSSTEEITAITYGADKIANVLGISDQLPCIVFLDAILNENKELLKISKLDKYVIPIKRHSVDEIMPLLRTIIQMFRNSTGYNDYSDDIQKLDKVYDNFKIATYAATQLREELSNKNREKKTFTIRSSNSVKKAHLALSQGSKRLFLKELSHIPGLSQETIGRLSKEMSTVYSILVKYSKCIETLKYHIAKEKRIDTDENQEKLKKIFTVYIEPLLEQEFQSQIFSTLFCKSVLDVLVSKQNTIIHPLLTSIPDEIEIAVLANQKFDHDLNCILEKLHIANNAEH